MPDVGTIPSGRLINGYYKASASQHASRVHAQLGLAIAGDVLGPEA
jgi:hypothetical protein